MGDQGERITEEAFKKFAVKHGKEKAAIYLAALNDFNNQLEAILGGGFCRDGVAQSGHMVKKEIIELRDHNKQFLETHLKNYICTPEFDI